MKKLLTISLFALVLTGCAQQEPQEPTFTYSPVTIETIEAQKKAEQEKLQRYEEEAAKRIEIATENLKNYFNNQELEITWEINKESNPYCFMIYAFAEGRKFVVDTSGICKEQE